MPATGYNIIVALICVSICVSSKCQTALVPTMIVVWSSSIWAGDSNDFVVADVNSIILYLLCIRFFYAQHFFFFFWLVFYFSARQTTFNRLCYDNNLNGWFEIQFVLVSLIANFFFRWFDSHSFVVFHAFSNRNKMIRIDIVVGLPITEFRIGRLTYDMGDACLCNNWRATARESEEKGENEYNKNVIDGRRDREKLTFFRREEFIR